MRLEIGVKFGRWSVLKLSDVVKSKPQYLCRCDCGTTKVVDGFNLTYGKSSNCGCEKKKNWHSIISRHGDGKESARAREYIAWCHIKSRCNNPNTERYPSYGGRGIKVCDRWLNSYENFLADMGRKPSAKHSIDRINVDGNYEPANCRWATDHEQRMNKRPRVRRAVEHRPQP